MGILDAIFSAAFEGKAPPAIPQWIEWKHITTGIFHCPTCLNLDSCWFTDQKNLFCLSIHIVIVQPIRSLFLMF